MNYLAHVLLAGPDPAYRLGGVMGDFVKGPLDSFAATLPPRIVAGVELHRRIDSFADAHAAFRASRARIGPLRRRYAGIMVDMFYDHFLACHWARYCEQSLEEFAAETYALLAAHAELLPPRLARALPRMRDEDWLSSYRSPAVIGKALDRMSLYRLRPGNTLAGALEDLHADYAGFECDFLVFIDDARAFAQAHRALRDG